MKPLLAALFTLGNLAIARADPPSVAAPPVADEAVAAMLAAAARAIPTYNVARLLELGAEGGRWFCQSPGSFCRFETARGAEETGPLRYFALTSFYDHAEHEGLDLQLAVDPATCLSQQRLESIVQITLKRAVVQPVAHCVPDFICKKQSFSLVGQTERSSSSMTVSAQFDAHTSCLEEVSLRISRTQLDVANPAP